MAITITHPQKEDKKEINQLFEAVITQTFKDYGFYDKYRKDVNYEIGKQEKALLQDFNTNGKDVYFLIAHDDKKIIGTIAFGKASSDIERYSNGKLKTVPEIKSAYVLPDYQGKGIGTQLFDTIVNALREYGYSEFCLDSGYPKAQAYWSKKLGNPIVRIKNRWGAGNDYLIWHHKILK